MKQIVFLSASRILSCLIVFSSATTRAGEADVADAKAERAADGSYSFTVTIRHADEGWEHYADRWQVVGPDGTVYGERILAHPHVDEQPFTRSQSGIVIPNGVGEVTVRAHDSVHDLGGKTFKVQISN